MICGHESGIEGEKGQGSSRQHGGRWGPQGGKERLLGDCRLDCCGGRRSALGGALRAPAARQWWAQICRVEHAVDK